jgi:hypothetical protein
MSRWKAAGLHLVICLIVASVVASVIYFVWYPPPYYRVSGGSSLTLLILGVDIVLGPMLTLAVFRAGKKGLKFDLTVIALLQIVALCYGLTIIAMARPVFVVAVVDRFIPVAANDIESADLNSVKDPAFASLSWFGPRLVGAVVPEEHKVELAKSALAGRDVEKFPQYYVPYDQVADEIIAHGKPLKVLIAKGPAESAQVSGFVSARGLKPENLVFVPLHGHDRDVAMLVSVLTKQPVGTLPIDPW